jgi:hypothetical protein
MSSRLKLISAATLTATVSSLLAPLAAAQATCDGPACVQRHVQRFGLVGVASGQDVQLSVVNPLSDTPEPVAPVCHVQVRLLSATGVELKSTVADLKPGQSTSLTLGRSPSLAGRRQPITAQVVAADAPEPIAPSSRCAVQSTLEVFDSLTGRTSVLTGPASEVVADVPEPV